MSKEIQQKSRSVYDFLSEKYIEMAKNGQSINPTCFAISFDKKNEVSVLPIPLSGLQTPDERRFLLKEMGKILKKEKVKVKMFITITKAWMSKVDHGEKLKYDSPSEDPNKKNVLLISARDCFENINYQSFEIKENYELEILNDTKNEWVKQTKNMVVDSLLDTIWSEYRNVK